MKKVKFHPNNYIHPANKKAIAFFEAMGVPLTRGDKEVINYDYWSGCPVISHRDVLYVDIDMGSDKFHKLLVDNDLLCGLSTLDYVDDSSARDFEDLCDLLGVK